LAAEWEGIDSPFKALPLLVATNSRILKSKKPPDLQEAVCFRVYATLTIMFLFLLEQQKTEVDLEHRETK
jgi:hypothetical protein